MPWLWVNFFGSVLKCDQLTQTGWFGKVLVPRVIFEHPCIALWLGGGAAMGAICGLSEDEGHVPPERLLRGGRREVDSFLVSSCFHTKRNSASPKVSLTRPPDPSTLHLLFAHCTGLQPLPGEASSPWFAGGGQQP